MTRRYRAEAATLDVDDGPLQVRDLEARLIAEREEKGRLMDEKQALGARLAKLRDAGTVRGAGGGGACG